MKSTLSIFSAVVLLVLVGCFTLPPQRSSTLSYNKTNEFTQTVLHRVLILPFEYDIDREAVISQVTGAFAVELRKLGRFEVIIPSREQSIRATEVKVWDKGSIDLSTVLSLSRKYEVDAIVFGSITLYRPYEPMLLGVKVGMISTNTGSMLWEADGVFDSNEDEVVALVEQYCKNTQQRKALYGWKIVLLSMRRYSNFVANQITKTLNY